MNKLLFYSACFICIPFLSISQKRFVSVSDESFIINSQTALNGKSFNSVEVTLPEKTTGIIYRIISSSIGNNVESVPLIKQLKEFTPDDFAVNNSLGRLATKANSPRAIDFYLINHQSDIGNFSRKEAFSYCKKIENRAEVCYYTDECLVGSKLFIGFVNNDATTGADVQFEMVAVIDAASDVTTRFPFVVSNSYNKAATLEWSADGINYSAGQTIPAEMVSTMSFPSSPMFLRVRTNLIKFKNYKVLSQAKYKVYWNTTFNGWDLAQE